MSIKLAFAIAVTLFASQLHALEARPSAEDEFVSPDANGPEIQDASGSLDLQSEPALGTIRPPRETITLGTSGESVGNLWDLVRSGFAMPEIDSALVARHEAWYLNHPEYFQRMIARGRLYLYYIVGELEKRQMPMEIALLPMIESAFNPTAYSHAHAAGIWQFIPSTGKRYGLKQNWWFDERRDVMEATRAALDYLQALHADFDDWELALAAYNWGENGVKRAIRRNKASRKPTDYRHLSMPRETRNYLPKLQAVKNIIANPSILSFPLLEVPDEAYFTPVAASHHMDVKVAASLAEISVEEFVLLNPAYNRPVVTAAGGRMLLLPVDKASVFNANLSSYDAPLVTWQTYTLKRKESLEDVAARFETDADRLRQINGIKRYVDPAPGRTLLVPLLEGSESSNLTDTWDNPEFQSPDDYYNTRIVHKVRAGDTLSTVAQRYRVSIRALKEWNHLRGTLIRKGQQLVIYRDPRVPQVSKMLQ
jgi:membrane-bound lytic murein transglycosylase D